MVVVVRGMCALTCGCVGAAAALACRRRARVLEVILGIGRDRFCLFIGIDASRAPLIHRVVFRGRMGKCQL